MSAFNLTGTLGLNISDFTSKLRNATAQANKFTDKLTSKMTSKGTNLSVFAEKWQRQYSDAAKELTKHNLGLKDTSRIVQGIMVSQAFYTVARSITDATRALWDFNTSLDYMQVTYSALFGSQDLATDFMAVLKEHSIETIFDYQGLADASKKLLAYGIDYKNLMFIMEGLTNLGAMSGDPQALDRIALALGQIYTKGKLSAEEMRQLANAYIPITEILQDKFGLTGEDLKRVGDLNLPAANVINAIVDYANENFASVGDAAMYTITGLQNKIVDSLKVIGVGMLGPITTAYKSFLAYVSNGLEGIRSAFDKGGAAGVFEYLVPDKGTQQTIRQFLANVRNLMMSLASVGVVVGKVFGNAIQVLVTAFNILSPVIIGVVNALASAINAFLSTEFGATALRIALLGAAAAFVLLRVQALGALVITAVTKAVQGLSKALVLLAAVIKKHPIISLLIALGALLIGVSTASNKANDAISGVFDSISGATGGSSSEDVLQDVNKTLNDSAAAASQFNQRLEESANGAKKLSNAISGAGKEAKKTGSLLSFDEVFKLPEQKDSSGSGSGSGGLLGDLEKLTAGFSNLGDNLIPSIPDFSEYAKNFTDNLFGNLTGTLSDKLKSSAIGASIGAILGAAIGLAFGNPVLGAKIGTAVGALAPIIWDKLGGALSNTASFGIAGILRTLAGTLAKSGAGVGFGTLIKNAFTSGGFKGVWTAVSNVIKNTGAKSLLKGGLISAAIGLVVDGIAHLLWTTLGEKIEGTDPEKAKVGQTIGSVIGTVLGAVLGGPVGSMIGSAIGTFVGGAFGLFYEQINENLEKVGLNVETLLGTAIGTGVLGPAGMLGGGIIGYILGDEETKKELTTWLNDTKGKLTTWWNDTSAGFTTWWTDTKEGFTTWYSDTKSGLTTWWTETKEGFTTWWTETKEGFNTWRTNTIDTFSDWDNINSETLSNWWKDTKEGFTTWWNDTTGGFTDWKTGTNEQLSSWWEETTTGFTTWANDTAEPIKQWCISTGKAIKDWAIEKGNDIRTWATNARADVQQWFVDTLTKIGNWVSETGTKIGKWASETGTKIGNWAKENGTVIGGFAIAAVKSIGGWLSETGSKISNWFVETKTKVRNGWSSLFDPNSWSSGWTHVKNWFSELVTSISTWFSSLGKKIGNWWDNIWSGKEVKIEASTSGSKSNPIGDYRLGGHAAGGIFNREHIARFAEGNKAEAIIPLENRSAMQPFVDAVSNGLVSTLAPLVATINAGNSSNLPPLYVGTLIADDRGLKELYKKFEVIQMQENDRRGIHAPSPV